MERKFKQNKKMQELITNIFNPSFPWVFYVSVKKRNWFCNFYKGRGANYLELQFFKLCITIGMPWADANIKYALKNPSWFHSMKNTNDSFSKWYQITICKSKYSKFNLPFH